MKTDIFVVGGGFAGLSAALYGVRAGRRVLVAEAEAVGGQINYAPRVENYPGVAAKSGSALADALFEQAMAQGVEVTPEKVLSVKKTEKGFQIQTDGDGYEAGAVILATGAKHRKLGLEKEELLSGVSYCAVCDGAFYKGKEVAVVGGGNAALQSAQLLSELCGHVTLIHRRKEFRGEELLVERLKKKPNVSLLTPYTVTALLGEEQLAGVVLENRENGQKKELFAAGLFIAVGQQPDNLPFEHLVALDPQGYILAAEDCRTTCPGIFVAGDCRTKQVRQLTTAAADGAQAALAASAWLEQQ